MQQLKHYPRNPPIMPTVKHEAFLDLENLASRIMKTGMVQLIGPALAADRAVLSHEWIRAHELIDEISFDEFAESKEDGLRTIATAALLLGVSRFGGDVRKSEVFKQITLIETQVPGLLNNAIEQTKTIVRDNAERGLKKISHEHIERKRRGSLENEIFKFDPSSGVAEVAASSSSGMLDLAATTMVSRVSNMGFLLEADARGTVMYKVNEVLDGTTCPVCRTMHNKEFPVPVGLAHLTTALSMGEPGVQRSLSPWPPQNKFNVSLLGKQSTDELAANGLSTPPYHPHCRGILVQTRAPQSLDFDAFSAAMGASSGILRDGDSIEQASALLFGDELEEEVFV